MFHLNIHFKKYHLNQDEIFLLIKVTIFYFFKDFIYLFFERGKGKDRGKHLHVVASHVPPTGNMAHNPGMCPDWGSNWRPFGSQAGTQSTEPHQPGHNFF